MSQEYRKANGRKAVWISSEKYNGIAYEEGDKYYTAYKGSMELEIDMNCHIVMCRSISNLMEELNEFSSQSNK